MSPDLKNKLIKIARRNAVVAPQESTLKKVYRVAAKGVSVAGKATEKIGKALQSKYGPVIAGGVIAGAVATPFAIRKIRERSYNQDDYYSY